MSSCHLDQLLKHVQEEGAKLNSHSLLKRVFIPVPSSHSNSTEVTAVSDSPANDTIRILQWNLLAQGLCQYKDGFILCPNEALDWKSRKFHMLEELLTYVPDVLCLQEVDQFSFLESHLQKVGYKGIFFPKPDSPCLQAANNSGPDGCAVFWNTDKINLIANENIVLYAVPGCATNQVAIICKFETQSEESERRQFFVTTTHLKSKVGYHKLRLLQGSYLEEYLERCCEGFPIVLCGDFNADPSEEIINVIKTSKIGFCSSYSLISDTKEEPPYTTWKVRGTHKGKEESCHTIDYLFFTQKDFKCTQLLQFPTYEEIGEGLLPSYAYPSDHFSLVIDLQFSSEDVH